jgi:molecular chaperone DnaK
MSSYIGIDLGTTYSAVATIDDTGRPKIIENNGKNITASCVALENDSLIVGDIPESRYGHKGFQIGARFKRHMGEDHITTLGSKSFTPADLSAAVLSEMRKIAEKEVGKIAEAVVTIPANWMQEARDATMLAAKKAGLEVKYIINEPTAAALYYSYKDGSSLCGNYAVYDLGGGTFDVSIVSVDGDNIEVIATAGVAKLGGDDFDKALREIIKEKIMKLNGSEVGDEDLPLSEMAKLKVKLSDRAKSPFMVNGEIVEITRTEFENTIEPLIMQAELLCETVLDDANLQASEIKDVFLAGGSTRVPSVKTSIKKIFCKDPLETANVDEVVALGAALYAAMKSSGEHLSTSQAATIEKLKVDEISTYYFGTLSVNYNASRNSEEIQNSVIINKGEKIPCSRTEKFSTRHEGQTAINCTVTKSGSPETDPRFVSTVWEGDLELPGGRPAGQVIEITYKFDENGMMKCAFLDIDSGRKTEIDLDSLSDQNATSEIDKFLVD